MLQIPYLQLKPVVTATSRDERVEQVGTLHLDSSKGPDKPMF